LESRFSPAPSAAAQLSVETVAEMSTTPGKGGPPSSDTATACRPPGCVYVLFCYQRKGEMGGVGE
jgi:hypothetical protein